MNWAATPERESFTTRRLISDRRKTEAAYSLRELGII